MGRSFKRKTPKINLETLRNAILNVRKGMPLREASRLYCVPRTSLRRQCEFNKDVVESTATELTPSDALVPSENAMPPEQRPHKSLETLQITDIVIKNIGRKTVCLLSRVSICFLLFILSYLLSRS